MALAITHRRMLALGLATVAVCLGLPEWTTDFARWVSGWGISWLDPSSWIAGWRDGPVRALQAQPWPALPALISVVLLFAAWLMIPAPRSIGRIAPVVRDETAMAVGALLLVEPLLHLGFLWWSSSHATAISRDAVFPVPFLGRLSDVPWWAGALTVLTVSVLVPIAEELFFRGRLLDVLRSWFGRSRFATVWAVSLTTLAFAGAHGSPVQVLFAIPFGLLLAVIRLRSGSIGGCVLAHACHNSMFLFLGPMLFAKPWVAASFAFSGALLIAGAWVLHQRTSPRPRVSNRWRPAIAVAAVLFTLLVIRFSAPSYHRIQDQLWAAAAHRVVVQWMVENDVLLHRIEYQRFRGRLNDERRQLLYDCLIEEPCSQRPGSSNPRQAQVLAILDPERFADNVPNDAIYDRLIDLADCQATWEEIGFAARKLGERRPDEMAAVATVIPICLVQWYDLNRGIDACLAQLLRCEGPVRRRFLSACERAFPGRVIDVLFALPVDRITAMDRRHLFVHYPDARERLRALSESDAERALGFLAPVE